MVTVLWPYTHTGTVIEPEPSLFELFAGNFQPLSSPNLFNTFIVHLPTIVFDQNRYPTITIATLLQCETGYGLSDFSLIVSRS